jgi:hypothetical protein
LGRSAAAVALDDKAAARATANASASCRIGRILT